MRLLLSAVALFVCSSCFRLAWRHDHRLTPTSCESVARLAVGSSRLGDALDALGAPLYVWERPDGGFALAYGWYEARDLGFTVSLPVVSGYSAPFDYTDGSGNLTGVVLFFDREGSLALVREGYLRDVAVGLDRRRPAFEDDEPRAGL